MSRRRLLTVVSLALAALPAAAQDQLWIRQFGTSAEDAVQAAAPDGASGVYLAGGTWRNLGGQNQGLEDAWLARYDSAGSPLWVRQFGTSETDFTYAAAPDDAGGVYVVGVSYVSPDGSSAQTLDLWLTRFNGAGNQLWIRHQIGLTVWDTAHAAAPDGSGGVYLCGSTYSSLGGSGVASSGVWLARYDSAGNQLWIRQTGGAEGDTAYAAASDGAGGVYLTGDAAVLGGFYTDVWLALYDSAGNEIWERRFGSISWDDAYAAAPDGSGGVYIAGETWGNLGGPMAGSTDAWVARYDAAGNQLWIRQFGPLGNTWATAAAPDGSGGVYLGGGGGLGWSGASGAGIWVARYDAAGDPLWIRQFGSGDYDGSYAAATDDSGGVYVAGDTLGDLGGPGEGDTDGWVARYDSSCPMRATYCTAKVNSLGCTPSIAMSNAPSASEGAGCMLTTTNVLGNQNGLFLHSTNGAQAASFHGGLLCVNPPLERHAVETSTGTAGTCNGTFREDFDSYIASGADPALVAGASVWIQHWSRDPGDPFGDGLSDAVTAVICP